MKLTRKLLLLMPLALLAGCDQNQPSVRTASDDFPGPAAVKDPATSKPERPADSPDAPWQYPIRLGDTRAQVHVLLGAAMRSDSILEEYPASGVSLWFDRNDRVTKLNFSGKAGEAYRASLEEMLSDQPLLFGLTARSNEAMFRKVLGEPREEQFQGAPGRRERRLVWKKAGYVIDGLFFVKVYKSLTCKEPCEVSTEAYPPGTLVWFEVYRGL